ncbi:Phospholipase A1 member A [Nibea albiflora]|uniref:Phospholipase A1 member A n=1 Tax=Nibea albiflora TaxID=240163 RepID=A0ACB7EFA2_NIBAL|nr:Phospholipase A1 member A [Nibea albiflora]
MPQERTAILLCVLAVYITSLVAGVEETQKDECADLNNTTWQEYRQQRTKLQVQYLLMTRKNIDCAQAFSHESLTESSSQQLSYFNMSLPTKVIIHGYRALGSKPSWVKQLARALLMVQDVNVLVVDWIYRASFAYNLVVENYKEVAVQTSVLINKLEVREALLHSSCHPGLDPAGPMFKTADTFDRLDPSDAQFVDAIHTDSDLYGYVICDHMRALHVYMSALNGSCPLMGIPCSSYEDFLRGHCTNCDLFKGKCPTIAHHILLVLEVSPLDKSAEVEVTLRTEHLVKERRLRLQTDTTVYRMVWAHPVALCEIDSIQLKNTGARFYRQGDIHVKSVCLSEFPSLRREEPLCVNNFNVRRGAPWSHDLVQVCDF